MTTHITIKSTRATAAHTVPTVISNIPEACCEETGSSTELGLALGTEELRHVESGTNSPEPSISVQAKGVIVM